MDDKSLFYSSDELFTINENTQEIESLLYSEDYLYYSHSARAPFVIFEEELKRLNNYLVFLLESSNQQKKEEIDSYSEIEWGNDFLGEGEVELGKSEIELSWLFNINHTLFPLGLTLILSFLESCLFDLSNWIDPESSRKVKRNKAESYLKILSQSLGTELVFSERLAKCRKLRNKFVHNQLEYNEIHEQDLRFAIDEVVKILFELEEAMIDCGKLAVG